MKSLVERVSGEVEGPRRLFPSVVGLVEQEQKEGLMSLPEVLLNVDEVEYPGTPPLRSTNSHDRFPDTTRHRVFVTVHKTLPVVSRHPVVTRPWPQDQK